LDRFELEFFAVLSLAGRSEAMKASKFTDALKACVVKEGEEGSPVADVNVGLASDAHQCIKFAGYTPARDRCVWHERQRPWVKSSTVARMRKRLLILNVFAKNFRIQSFDGLVASRRLLCARRAVASTPVLHS
jgi:hypothetical protein